MKITEKDNKPVYVKFGDVKQADVFKAVANPYLFMKVAGSGQSNNAARLVDGFLFGFNYDTNVRVVPGSFVEE